MTQTLSNITTSQRSAARARFSLPHGAKGEAVAVCLSRQASDWARDSRLGSDELRGLGLGASRSVLSF